MMCLLRKYVPFPLGFGRKMRDTPFEKAWSWCLSACCCGVSQKKTSTVYHEQWRIVGKYRKIKVRWKEQIIQIHFELSNDAFFRAGGLKQSHASRLRFFGAKPMGFLMVFHPVSSRNISPSPRLNAKSGAGLPKGGATVGRTGRIPLFSYLVAGRCVFFKWQNLSVNHLQLCRSKIC